MEIMGLLLLVALFMAEVLWGDTREQSKFINKVAREEENYFGRLSNIDRKRWIAEEHYRRVNYGITTLNDSAME